MAETREQMAAKLDRMARFNYAHSPSTAAALRAGAAALRAQDIAILCRKCHMAEDGRLEAVKQTARAMQPKAVAARW